VRDVSVFPKILVALDGSEDAGSAGAMAVQLARRFGSDVLGLCVIDVRVVEGPAVETLAPLWGEVTGRPFQPEVMRLYRERAESTLDDLCAKAEAEGAIRVERCADIGVAEETILEKASTADLLVMGRRGEHAGFGRQPMGATLWRVLHRATHPVLVAGRTAGTHLPVRPLVAWDSSPGSRKALDLAIRYATAVQSALNVVHAGDESRDSMLEEAHAALRKTGLTWESARLDADPSDAVAEAVTRWEADCLFMGAFGRGRLRDLLFGSHTTEIFERIAIPVFVTP
jgi:nucleotide-binding universal stress UspA family protein